MHRLINTAVLAVILGVTAAVSCSTAYSSAIASTPPSELGGQSAPARRTFLCNRAAGSHREARGELREVGRSA